MRSIELRLLSFCAITLGVIAGCGGSSPSFDETSGSGGATSARSTAAAGRGATTGDGGGGAGDDRGSGGAGGDGAGDSKGEGGLGDDGSGSGGAGGDGVETTVAAGPTSTTSVSTGGAAAPNLRLISVATTLFDATDRTYVCLNDRPDGAEDDFDDEILVTNLGDADATTYHLTFALYSQVTGTEYLCGSDLNNPDGTAAGDSDRWDGPFCCDFGEVPVGDYYFRIVVDAYDEVAESDETDNVYETNEVNVE